MYVCRKDRTVLFNDALNTSYLRLYCVRHMVKREKTRNNGYFICIIPQTGSYIPRKISRFQIDASLTNSFALRRPSTRGDSYTSPVVVGRQASTWCQRPNDTSLGASVRKPRAARWARWLRWYRWLRWARRALTCMPTCVFFPLICLACFPSSATASTDRFGDGHFSAEIDLSL